MHQPKHQNLHHDRPAGVRVRELRQQRQEQQEDLRVESADARAFRCLPQPRLRVIAADLPAFQQLYDDRLATLPGVQRLSSTLVMKSIVENRALPL